MRFRHSLVSDQLHEYLWICQGIEKVRGVVDMFANCRSGKCSCYLVADPKKLSLSLHVPGRDSSILIFEDGGAEEKPLWGWEGYVNYYCSGS